jgi:Flp pilus assembly protein TadG
MDKRRQSGVAAVELAILLVPMLLLAFGMTELGRALYYYNQVVAATRDGARFLSFKSRGQGEAEARCLVVHGNPSCAGAPLVLGLTTDRVRIDYAPAVETGHGSLDMVTVTVEGLPYTSLVPLAFDSLTFGPIATHMRQAAT